MVRTDSQSPINTKGLITDYRTFADDMYKVLEFVEWYKEWY